MSDFYKPMESQEQAVKDIAAEMARLLAENERLRAALTGLIERYAARTQTGSIVSSSEQYPWIAQAMCELKRS